MARALLVSQKHLASLTHHLCRRLRADMPSSRYSAYLLPLLQDLLVFHYRTAPRDQWLMAEIQVHVTAIARKYQVHRTTISRCFQILRRYGYIHFRGQCFREGGVWGPSVYRFSDKVHRLWLWFLKKVFKISTPCSVRTTLTPRRTLPRWWVEAGCRRIWPGRGRFFQK